MINPVTTIILLLISGIIVQLAYKHIGKYSVYAVKAVLLYNIIVYSFLIPYLSSEPMHAVLGGLKAPYGISLSFTYMSVIFSLAVNVIALLILLNILNSGIKSEKAFLTVFPIIVAGLVGIINTTDIFNLFVFMEIATVGMYVMAGTSERDADLAVIKFITGTSIGSLLMLAGIALIYRATGTLNLHMIAPHAQSLQLPLALFLTGLMFELYIFPGNLFVIDLYSKLPPAFAAFFSGVAQTAMLYAFVRIFGFIFDSSGMKWLMYLGIVTYVFGELSAAASKKPQRILAFSSFAFSGLVTALMMTGIDAVKDMLLMLILIHGIAKYIMFSSVQSVSDTDGHIVRGFAAVPFSVTAFIIAMLTLAGIPPFPGFLVKFPVLMALAQNHVWLIAVILIMTLVEIYYLFMLSRKMYIVKESEGIESMPLIASLGLAVLVILLVIINPDRTVFSQSGTMKSQTEKIRHEIISNDSNLLQLKGAEND